MPVKGSKYGKDLGESKRIDNLSAELAQTAKLSPGKKGILYAGVIRNDGTGWKFITDTVHNNINFTGISETANKEIQVDYTDAKMIGSMLVSPDETLAGYGLICGASVGDKSAFIKSFAPFTGYISGSGVVTTSEWFTNTFSVTPYADGTGFTLDYDGGSNNADKVMTTSIRDLTTHEGLEIRTARPSGTQVIFKAYHDLYANIYYDGAAWQVASSCKANITCSFNSTTGELTITHDSMPNVGGNFEFQNPQVSERDSVSGSLIHARIASVNQTQMKIIFRDNAGTKLLNPSTDMRIYIERTGFKVPHLWNQNARVYFDLGYSIVRPNKLVSASGNLWLLGLHEAN